MSGAAAPTPGASLYCDGSIAEILAGAGILQTVCTRFLVLVEEAELDRIRAELREQAHRQDLADWLRQLIDRINLGFDSGAYVSIPRTGRGVGDQVTEVDRQPEVQCLIDLLELVPQHTDAIWVDDRWVTSFSHRGGAPIVGILEILKALVSAKVIDEATYYAKLIQLRAGNVRFLPVHEEEILYHLRRANVDEGTVVETQALTVLRRYVAACLASSEVLQHPPLPEGSPEPRGEVPFLLTFVNAVNRALVELWKGAVEDDPQAEARANWLLANLHIDLLGLATATSIKKPDADDRDLAAATIATLLSQAAIDLNGNRPAGRRSACQQYLAWVFERLVARRFEADPALLPTVAEVLKQTVLSPLQEDLSGTKRRVAMALLGRFYKDLPEVVQDELARDSDFMANLGVASMTIVGAGGLQFTPDDFWAAAADTLNGREAKIVPLAGKAKVTFHPFEHAGRRGFSFSDPATGTRRVVLDEDLDLLLDSADAREAVLRRNPQWFECSAEALERVIAEIASIQDPRRRVEAERAWRNASAGVYYANLSRQLARDRSFRLPDLVPPDGLGLLRHFRLDSALLPGVQLREALSAAAVSLCRDQSLYVAIERQAAFPIPLPQSLIEATSLLSASEKRALLKRLAKTAGSPISRFHLLHLLIACGPELPASRRLARRIIRSLLKAEDDKARIAFLALLRWVNNEFNYWSGSQGWPPLVRLAMVWAHTHRLFGTFAAARVDFDWLAKTVTGNQHRLPPEMLNRDPQYWNDIAHPRQVNSKSLALMGLAYAIGSHAGDVVNDALQELFLDAIFPSQGHGEVLPALQLLKDSNQARNGLDSFLGGDRGEKLSAVIGPEAGTFSRSALKEMVQWSVANLSHHENWKSAWIQIQANLDGLPAYDDQVGEMVGQIRQTDFVSLCRSDVEHGIVAIFTAALQATNLRDKELWGHLRGQLLAIAKLVAESDAESQTEYVGSLLLEAALNLAVAGGGSREEAVAEFASIVGGLVGAWPTCMSDCAPVIQRLYEELPIAESQQLAGLLIHLRAR